MHDTNHLNSVLNDRLIHVLKEILGRDKANKTALCKEMGITTSVLYKRLSGHSQFTLGELAFLMDKYSFSFDEWVMRKEDIIPVSIPYASNNIGSVDDYLLNLKGLFHQLKQIPDSIVHYATREVPIFYYFMNPMVGAFKLFLFGRVVWDLKSFSGAAKFSMNHFSKTNLESMKEIWELYTTIPSIEIWNPNIWDNTFQQILYLLEIRAFENPIDAVFLVDHIKNCIQDCEKMATSGRKFKYNGRMGADLKLYNNRIMHTNNLVLAGNDHNKLLFITHDNPNYIFSKDPTLIQYTERWFDKLKLHSSDLMLSDTVQKDDFFRTLYSKASFTRQKVDDLIRRDQEMI